MNASAPSSHVLKQMSFVYGPRISYAVDLIPSLTKTERGNTALFLAVDMFTGYIQLQPIKSRQTSELIEAVKTTILSPFGIPKFFRCDNESGMANSIEFKKFLDPLKLIFCLALLLHLGLTEPLKEQYNPLKRQLKIY